MNGPRHILLVDDEAGLRFSVGLALRMAGFKVSEAADGKDALDTLIRCRDEGTPVDLVVTDLRMPNLSGIELVSALRQHEVQVHIFVISGSCDESVVNELAGAGGVEHMERPFLPEELIGRIVGILGKEGGVKGNLSTNTPTGISNGYG